MRLSGYGLAAAMIAASIGYARADVWTYSAQVSGANGEAMFMLPGFAPSKGTLDAVSVVINGAMGAEISGGSGSLNPTSTPQPVFFQPVLTLNGIASPDIQVSGNATGLYMPYADTYRTPGFMVSGTIGQKPSFFDGGATMMDLLFGAWVHDAPAGQINEVGGSADWSLMGTATAYYTYTAIDPPADPPGDPVPEPGSLLLLATGMAWIAMATRKKSRAAI